MLQWEVDALRATESIGKIYAVGNIQADGLDVIVPPTDGFLGNIIAGISRAESDGVKTVLLATSDIPLITPEAVDGFVRAASALNSDFCYPIISKEDCLAKYPGMHRTYLRLKEGTFSGGNMVLIQVDFLLRNRELIESAYQARKNPLRLAGMVGWGILARVLVAQFVCATAVDITALESAVSRLLNGKVRAVITPYAEIGEDVDKPEDLAAVNKLIADRWSEGKPSPA
jgi:2-phospho-L-lactate guanylyltransferase (CobY/MobA/RfbA family)